MLECKNFDLSKKKLFAVDSVYLFANFAIFLALEDMFIQFFICHSQNYIQVQTRLIYTSEATIVVFEFVGTLEFEVLVDFRKLIRSNKVVLESR